MARLVNAAPAEARRQSEILRSAQNDSSDIRRRPARVILREAKNLALRPRCQLGPTHCHSERSEESRSDAEPCPSPPSLRVLWGDLGAAPGICRFLHICVKMPHSGAVFSQCEIMFAAYLLYS